MKNKYSKFFIINFILLTLLSKSQIIQNPIIITDDSNIDDYIINMKSDSVQTSDGIPLKIIKDENNIIYKNKSFYLNPNIILCKDQSNNYFLFMENYYYKIKPNNANNEVENLELQKSEPLPHNAKYFGFIREKYFKQPFFFENARSNINQDEIILYGKKDRDIYFYYIKESDYSYPIDDDKDKISCKFLTNLCFICAYFNKNHNKIILDIFIHEYYLLREKIIKKIKTEKIEGINDYDNLIFYDTENDNYKILCAAKNRKDAICKGIYISTNYGFPINLNFKDLNSDYVISFSVKHKCYITGFNSEFLSCCGDNNMIKCYRNNKENFILIKEFSINLIGNISSVIISNNSDHAIISYINDTTKNKYLYQYFIYPPKCNNITMELKVFESSEINLSSLFIRKTNTKYYFHFLNFPSDYGILKIGEEEINYDNNKIEYKNEEESLSFKSNNNKVINNFDILYELLIDETYSTICKISLKISGCYQSCDQCLENNFLETSEYNHNCQSCKEEENYFPYVEKPNNC